MGGVVAVCPGSFDPVHEGHLDVVRRASGQLDEVVLAVIENPSKVGSETFSIDERVELAEAATADLRTVRVARFTGLLVDWTTANDVGIILKGIRSGADLDYEMTMAQMNRRMTGVETLFIPTAPELAALSSSLIKEIARLGGDVSWMVPDAVLRPLLQRIGA